MVDWEEETGVGLAEAAGFGSNSVITSFGHIAIP
jgi:hypothetical protein